MRKTTFSTLALVTVLLLGCGPALSLHSLFTDEDVSFDSGIVGVWGEKRSECWTIRKSPKGNTYDFIYTSGKGGTIIGEADSLSFVGRLVKIGGYTFMDITTNDSNLESFLAIPVHAFLRLSLEGDSLGIAYLDDDWLKDNIEKNKIRIKHELVDDGILLTASPKELQELVRSCAEDKKAFDMEYSHRLK
ncbi:hypothetical protein LLH00_11295 [bacterium]|nr:hypothetical protein [bacterium]